MAESFVDLDRLRQQIDSITPDLRELLPLDATKLGTFFMVMYLHGMAGMLGQDDLPWEAIGANPDGRRESARHIRSDARRLLHTLVP